MPFRLIIDPAMFMHLMHDVFQDLLDTFVVIYLVTSWCTCLHLKNTGPMYKWYSSACEITTSSQSMKSARLHKPPLTFWANRLCPRASPWIQRRLRPCSLGSSCTE